MFSPLGTPEARLSSEQPYRPVPKQNLTPSTCREGRCSRLRPHHVNGCRARGLCAGAQRPGRAPGGGGRRSRDPQAWLGSHRGGGSQADKRGCAPTCTPTRSLPSPQYPDHPGGTSTCVEDRPSHSGRSGGARGTGVTPLAEGRYGGAQGLGPHVPVWTWEARARGILQKSSRTDSFGADGPRGGAASQAGVGSAPPWKGKKTKTTLSPAHTPTSVAQARPASRGPAGSAPGSVYTDTCLLPLSHYSGISAREGSPAASRPHTPTARSHRASRRTPPLAKISLETRRRAGAGPRAACHPAARSRQVPLRHPRWQRLRLVLRGHGRRGSGKWEEGRAGPAANLVFYQSTDSFRQAS